MADQSRLTQLRALVARLEHMPASSRREWMLEAARARMVDVETGFPSETMRPLDADRHAPAAEPRPRGPSNPGSGKPPRRAVAAKRLDPAPPELPPLVGEPAAPPADMRPAPFVLEIAGDPSVGGGKALVDTGELLWLEDSPTVTFTAAASATGSAPLPLWRRGLRG